MEVTDQLNRTIFLPKPPTRIISLVPSQTELLVDLGLEDRIVGVTKFCIHPSHLRKSKSIVGGTKNYRFEVIDSLQPDLILGNKEENDQSGIERLAEKYPVWMSDMQTLNQAYQMIDQVGILTDTQARAQEIIQEISNSFAFPFPKKGSCIYLIWNDPLMAAGQSTFIHDMLKVSGFENIIEQTRYPQLTEEQLIHLSPDFLLLSSEPFPFKTKHIEYFKELLPNAKIGLVDGEMFSWYGSRLKHSAGYFKTLSF